MFMALIGLTASQLVDGLRDSRRLDATNPLRV